MRARFRYTGIRVKDLDASVRFYTRVLGMTAQGPGRIDATKGRVIDMVTEGADHPLELNYYEDDSPYASHYEVGEGLDHLAFKVSDLDEAVREAERAGHPVVEEVRAGGSRWVYIEDPNGIWIELSAEQPPA